MRYCKLCNEKRCLPAPARGNIGPRIALLGRLEKSNFNRAVAAEGLFSGQHRIIMMLKREKSATISEIAEETGTAPATVSVSIKRMEKAGFVAKKVSSKDARRTEIYLTKKGEKAPEHIKAKLDAEEKILTNGLSEEEVLALSDILDKLIDNYTRQEEMAND